MLADGADTEVGVIGLRADLHLPDTTRLALIDFIRHQLPGWRDHPERQRETAEEPLTGQLCDHLNDVSRHGIGWDHFKFSTERRDEKYKNRKYDLAVQPSGRSISVGAEIYSTFEIILPIECKLLPTPKGTKRDEREYLFDKHKSSGGVQRFKAGHHGSKHKLCAMIGYVQSGKPDEWLAKINGWVTEMATIGLDGWCETDALLLDKHDKTGGLAWLSSRHSRIGEYGDIDLKHLWIEMERTTPPPSATPR